MPQRLQIALAEARAVNTSEKLLNDKLYILYMQQKKQNNEFNEVKRQNGY